MNGVKGEISQGRLKSGQPLPSFRILAEQLLVSLITVKRAYEELEREGIIYRKQGLGTFVSDQGDTRNREIRRLRAENLMKQAIEEASTAGMAKTEILELCRKVIGEQEGKET